VGAASGWPDEMSLTSGPYTDEVRGNAEAGWVTGITNLERLLAAA
jgi:hypothetical protein